MGREQQVRLIRELGPITHEEDPVRRIHRNEKLYYVFINVLFHLNNSVRGSLQCSKLIISIVFFKSQGPISDSFEASLVLSRLNMASSYLNDGDQVHKVKNSKSNTLHS
jgi:hypothetical protein